MERDIFFEVDYNDDLEGYVLNFDDGEEAYTQYTPCENRISANYGEEYLTRKIVNENDTISDEKEDLVDAFVEYVKWTDRGEADGYWAATRDADGNYTFERKAAIRELYEHPVRSREEIGLYGPSEASYHDHMRSFGTVYAAGEGWELAISNDALSLKNGERYTFQAFGNNEKARERAREVAEALYRQDKSRPRCWNCGAELTPEEAAGAVATRYNELRQHGEATPWEYVYQCRQCNREQEAARRTYAEAVEHTHESPAV